jgi:transposase-like protein
MLRGNFSPDVRPTPGVNPKSETEKFADPTMINYEGSCKVAKRGPYRKYTKEFRKMAVERMAECDNIEALARELDVPSRALYHWRDRQVARVAAGPLAPGLREMRLRNENAKLKKALAEKTLEVDFFKGALQKVKARRQQSDVSGAKASTTKSGN